MKYALPLLRAIPYSVLTALFSWMVQFSALAQPTATILHNNTQAQFNPSVEFNPGNANKICVVAADRNTSLYKRIAFFESTNSGGAWTRSVLEDGAFAIRGEWSDLAFNYDGTETYAVMTDYNWDAEYLWARSNAIQLLRKRPSPGYWETTTILSHTVSSEAPLGDFEREPSLNYSYYQPNDLYATWTKTKQSGSNEIWFARSTDNGGSFATPIKVNDGGGSVGISSSCVVSTGNNQYTNYVFWLQSSPARIRIDQKNVTATTFGTDATFVDVYPATRGTSAPRIATAANEVHITWAAKEFSFSTVTEIFYGKLSDSQARIVTNRLPGNQWSPSVSVMSDGKVFITFYSQKDDNSPVEVYLAASTDGENFVYTRLAEASPSYAALQTDYLGIAANTSVAYSVWAGINNGNLNLFGSTFFPKTVSLEQRFSNGTSFGTMERWVADGFNQLIPSGTNAIFYNNATGVLRAFQSSALTNGHFEKFYNWNDVGTDILNHREYVLSPGTTAIYAKFGINYEGWYTLKNVLVDNASASSSTTTIEFRDPWLADYQDPAHGNQKRSRGQQDAIWHQFYSPFTPAFSNTGVDGQAYAYRGLFPGQNPGGQLPYYSIRVPFSQSFAGTTGSFVGWGSDGSVFSSPSSLETDIKFSSSTDVVRALYKLPLKTSESIHHVSQPKIARSHATGNPYGMVYASGGDIFFTRSTNNGTTWGPEVLVSSGNGQSSNPSIESVFYYGGMDSYRDSYIVWEENPIAGGTTGYRIWMRKKTDGSTDAWSPSMIVHEDLNSAPASATPVVSGSFVFWKGPSSILWKSVLKDATYPAYTVSGTDANSLNFAVDFNWDYVNEGDAYITWEQTNSGIKYRKGYLNWNGTATWNSLVSVATNTEYEINASPVVVSDYAGNGCIAWEFKNTFTQQGNIKFCRVNTSNAITSASTFVNCPGTTHYPTYPSISHARNNSTGQNDLTMTWQTSGDGIICALYKNGNLSSPFLLNAGGKYASVNRTIYSGDNTRVAFAMGNSSSAPYQLQVLSIPTNASLPSATTLVTPIEGATTSTFSTTLTWNCVLGASGYNIQVATDQQFQFLEYELSSPTPSTNLMDLAENTYYWRVQATNSSGSGGWTAGQSFTAEEIIPGITLSWTTSSGHPNLSWVATGQSTNTFNLTRYRCIYGQGDCNGTPTLIYTGTATSYYDASVDVASKTQTPTSTYYYRVTATTASNKVSVNAYEQWKQMVEDDPPIPTEYRLYANHPNPFNPTTLIRYDVPVENFVVLRVLNSLGQEVRTLVNEFQSAGRRSVEFDAGELPSGMYFYRLQAGKFTETKKMLLLK